MKIDPFYSRNREWQKQLRKLRSFARSEHPILLLGPSGTGKDILAREIHRLSQRSSLKLISVNCGAIQENLVESELFGHKKGSFTGAQGDRKGAFLSAHHSSLFLDEVGDLNLAVQAKLLRVLENRSIKAVGDDHEKPVNVRIIAATHKELDDMVTAGTFRMDLFFRLNVIQFRLPSLNERIEDLPLFLQHFAEDLDLGFTEESVKVLTNHHWVGNIRELKNFVARAACLYRGQIMDVDQVSQMLIGHTSRNQESENRPMTFDLLQQIERGLLLEKLVANNWNQRKTARDLGIAKSTLHDRLKKMNLDREVTQRRDS